MPIGILCKQEVRELNPAGPQPHCVSRPSSRPVDDLLNESSLDLPLGDQYWRMKGSCRTGTKMKVSPDLIRLFSASGERPTPLTGDLVLERGCVYLFKVDCTLNLAETRIRGKATARSSIGRLDVLVRLLCDETSEFDRIPEDYDGPLYVEVTPITFNLAVRPGTCLSQLRLFRGSDRLVSITQEEFGYEKSFPVVGDEKGFASEDMQEVWYPFRLDLSPDTCGCSGFVAKKDTGTPIDPTKRKLYDPREFWERVDRKDDAIELQPDRLYILRSKEHLHMPGGVALECQAYTETMGEWRIEYAGFAHPFFGWSRERGSPLIFEVRGHNIPTIFTDAIPLGNVCFKRMSKPADQPREPSQYEDQELKLSGCFKDWAE